MKYCIFNLWYKKPETKDGPPGLNFWNEVGKGKLEPKLFPIKLEIDTWYRVVVKQIRNKDGKYHLRNGFDAIILYFRRNLTLTNSKSQSFETSKASH